MTRYICELSDHQELDVEAAGVMVDGGALRFTDGGATVLLVAARVWRSVRDPSIDRLPVPAPKVSPPGRSLPMQYSPPDGLRRP